jgi:hypothetical protein
MHVARQGTNQNAQYTWVAKYEAEAISAALEKVSNVARWCSFLSTRAEEP